MAADDPVTLESALEDVPGEMDLRSFAYLLLPSSARIAARLIANYPGAWAARYLANHYETVDPVIVQAQRGPQSFIWGLEADLIPRPESQERFSEEAARFGLVVVSSASGAKRTFGWHRGQGRTAIEALGYMGRLSSPPSGFVPEEISPIGRENNPTATAVLNQETEALGLFQGWLFGSTRSNGRQVRCNVPTRGRAIQIQSKASLPASAAFDTSASLAKPEWPRV